MCVSPNKIKAFLIEKKDLTLHKICAIMIIEFE
jgi:hypothetical protein